MADVASRLRDLVAYLAHHPPCTREDLAEHLPAYAEGDAGRQAFERDKKLLRSARIPLREEGDRYWIEEAEYFLDLDLSREERVALGLATAAVPIAGGPSLAARLSLGGLGGRLVDPAPFFADLDHLDALPLLNDACRTRSVLGFTYSGRPRAVEPYGVLFRQGFWYLHGLDRADVVRKNFRVDRLEGTPTVGVAGAFDRPADVDLREELVDEAWQLPGDNAAEVVVRVDAVLGPKAAKGIGEASILTTHTDGAVELRLVVTNRSAFRSWLFGFREHAVVVGPPEVRAELRAWLSGVVAADPGAT